MCKRSARRQPAAAPGHSPFRTRRADTAPVGRAAPPRWRVPVPSAPLIRGLYGVGSSNWPLIRPRYAVYPPVYLTSDTSSLLCLRPVGEPCFSVAAQCSETADLTMLFLFLLQCLRTLLSERHRFYYFTPLFPAKSCSCCRVVEPVRCVFNHWSLRSVSCMRTSSVSLRIDIPVHLSLLPTHVIPVTVIHVTSCARCACNVVSVPSRQTALGEQYAESGYRTPYSAICEKYGEPLSPGHYAGKPLLSRQ